MTTTTSNDARSRDQSNTGHVEAETTHGRIRGMTSDGIHVFKGIPYGASTAGENRFMPPRPVAPWSGTRDALEFGMVAPQPTGNTTEYGRLIGWDKHPGGMGEDCLMLNVWTPGVSDGHKRAVMLSIHGGGFVSGSGSTPGYNGKPLAKLGDVVVVTVNHRLGALGYLHLGDLGPEPFAQSGTVGMLDLVAALRWVRDNIEHFGGDPECVMVFGQSGGGAKTSTLMAMPSAKGLFHRAAVQSGSALRLMPRELATEMAKRLLSQLGLDARRVGDLQKLSFEDILGAQAAVTAEQPMAGFAPVVDGDAIPRHPFDPTAPEVSADVPLIVGSTLDDAAMGGRFDIDEAGVVASLAKRYGDRAHEIVETYRRYYPEASPFLLEARMRTDRRVRRAARTQAERKAALGKAPAYLYLWTWPSPAMGGKFGAVHGVDVGMAFNNARGPVAGDTDEARALARRFASCWVAFAKTGDPNDPAIPRWPAYEPVNRSTMVFDSEITLRQDPLHELRTMWDELHAGDPRG